MARGRVGRRGGSVLSRVDWVFSLGTGSVWVGGPLNVWVHTERTECAAQPHVTVG